MTAKYSMSRNSMPITRIHDVEEAGRLNPGCRSVNLLLQCSLSSGAPWKSSGASRLGHGVPPETCDELKYQRGVAPPLSPLERKHHESSASTISASGSDRCRTPDRLALRLD